MGEDIWYGYICKCFAQSLALSNKVGALAEAEGHHPDLCLDWEKREVEIWSHMCARHDSRQ